MGTDLGGSGYEEGLHFILRAVGSIKGEDVLVLYYNARRVMVK